MISIGANIYLYWGLIVKDVRKITTDEVREAYMGILIQTGENTYELIDEDTAGTEFDLWLVTERKRVAQMAIEKERKRILDILRDDCHRYDENTICPCGAITPDQFDYVEKLINGEQE